MPAVQRLVVAAVGDCSRSAVKSDYADVCCREWDHTGEVRPSVGQNCPTVVIAEGLEPAAKGDPVTTLNTPVD